MEFYQQFSSSSYLKRPIQSLKCQIIFSLNPVTSAKPNKSLQMSTNFSETYSYIKFKTIKAINATSPELTAVAVIMVVVGDAVNKEKCKCYK